MKKSNLNTPFIRFIIVGIFNTILGYGIILFLFHIVGLSYSMAYFFSYIIGFIISYFLTRSFVFKSQQKRAIEFMKFIVAFGISYGCSYFLLHLCIEYKVFPINISFLVGMIIYSLCFYLLNKYITFKS